ncbi:hypothetical protein HIM_11280 [Hirsutella minnesotensis 3608]|uniref:AAA+ ATPase domain-containing protein n=1 Tax=Hirsutella minnesotensis 3608 TaxID=1043627 RepID=A0A0F7ZWP3_9HYPO|nr:hypothetical protein HIM_11280 [Hirsutella minnesotensis 3608]
MNAMSNTDSSRTWDLPRVQQLGVLDILFPTAPVVKTAQLFSLGFSSYTWLACCLGLLALSRTYLGQVKFWLAEHFTSTVHIRRSDEAYDMVLTWLTTHGLENAARSTIARVGSNRGTSDDLICDIKKPLNFSPWNGGFLFCFQRRLLSYRSELKDAGFHKEEEISITCAGRSCSILKEFLRECRDEYLNQVSNRTTIFENRGDRWRKVATKKIRPLSTVIVSEKLKQQLIADLKSFLDPETRSWFAKRTIPYRKGYLLHGPPGTGKSSFSLSVAGEFDVDLYIVSMPGVNDRTLKDLFADLPQKCVVLLEDIDAVGMERSPDSNDFDDESLKPKNGVTMSGLLNTLDGVASQEGRVLIMTTNHIEKLDEALIRPGRVDKKAEFQYADAAMTSQLFGFVFQQDAGEDGSCNDSAVCDFAADFVAKVPELEFSPAEILSHLLQYRESPTAAIEHAEEWVATIRREKGRIPNKAASRRLYLDGPAWKSEMASAHGRPVFDDDKDKETEPGLGFSKTPPSSPAQGSTGKISASSQRRALALSAVGELRDELTVQGPSHRHPDPEILNSILSVPTHECALCTTGAYQEPGSPQQSLSSRDNLDEPPSPRPLLAPSPEPASSSEAKRTTRDVPQGPAEHRQRRSRYNWQVASRPSSPSKLAWWQNDDKTQVNDRGAAHTQ